LNSAYGKYRLMNTAKQAVSMANISPPELGRITVPLPSLPLQEKFARLVIQIEALRTEMYSKVNSFEALQNQVRQQAFVGALTESWREKHSEEITQAATIREDVLSLGKTKAKVQFAEIVPPERPTDFSRPMRQWLIDELSEFQHEVWNMLRHEWRGLVIVDDPEVFDDFCTNSQIAWRIEHFKASNKRIRQTLEQLAALGLIAKVSVPTSNAVTQQIEYLTAFRPLREDENTRLVDATKLRSELEQSESASSNNSDISNQTDKLGSW